MFAQEKQTAYFLPPETPQTISATKAMGKLNIDGNNTGAFHIFCAEGNLANCEKKKNNIITA